MEFPVIIIDSINNSIKSGDDEEEIFIDTSHHDEYHRYLEKNSLRIQTNSNNDDGDSGIHESSEVLGPSPVPSHRQLLESSHSSVVGPGLQRNKRSLSANSLIERKRSFSQSFMKATKNRNFSIDTGRPTNIQIRKSFSPYKLMILDEDGKTILVQKVSRDSVRSMTQRSPVIQNGGDGGKRKESQGQYMNDLCQIHLLLIIMKIVLGGSVTVFGLFLKAFSNSLEVKDCGYWASSLLLISGLVSVYFATDHCYFKNKKLHYIYWVLTLTVSLSSSILCMIASVHSGAHGNWISFYADDCTSIKFGANFDRDTICCVDRSTDKSVLDHIQWSPSQNHTHVDTICSCVKRGKVERLYSGFSCKYLFSSLKDYFVLICSLMAVGSGCDIWFVVHLLRSVCGPRTSTRNPCPAENFAVDVNVGSSRHQLPSPIIPAVLFPKSKPMQAD